MVMQLITFLTESGKADTIILYGIVYKTIVEENSITLFDFVINLN